MNLTPPTRLAYMDALRGLAILLMVQDHAFDWWLRREFHATPWGRITEFLGTLAAPLFLFLMGFSLALSTRKRLRSDHLRKQVALSQLRRGTFLILQGYIVTWLVFYNGHNREEMWAVDVLHCLGLSMVVLIPLALVRTWPLTLLVTVAAAAISPWVGNCALPSWLGGWLTGSNGVSYFPLLPFVVYALAGLALGQLYLQMASGPHGVRWFMLALVTLGTGTALVVPLVPPELGARFPRPQFLLFSVALILYLTSFFYALDRRLGPLRLLSVMGRTAMMLYIVHQLLGFRLFYHLGWVTGHSWEGQYGVFDPAAACALLVLLLAVLTGLAALWLHWRPRIGPAALMARWAPILSAYW